MELRAGTQVCKLKEKIKASSLKYIKLEVLSTHCTEQDEAQSSPGHFPQAQQTYLNQVMLYPGSDSRDQSRPDRLSALLSIQQDEPCLPTQPSHHFNQTNPYS